MQYHTRSHAIWLNIGILLLATAESQPYRYTVISHCYLCDILIWTWLYASAVDWMEAHLNASLQSIVGNMQGLKVNYCLKKVWQTSPERNLTFHIKICMSELFIIRSITSIKKQDRVDFTSMLTWKKTDWFRQSTIKSKGFIYRLGSGFNFNFHVDLYSYTAWYSSHLKVHNTCCVTCNQYE